MQNKSNLLKNILQDFLQQLSTVAEKFVLFAPDFTTSKNSTTDKITFRNIKFAKIIFILFTKHRTARSLGVQQSGCSLTV